MPEQEADIMLGHGSIITLPADGQTPEELMDHLRSSLDDICERVAERFCLYDERGRPKKAYIVDVLTHYACPSCVLRALSKLRERAEVDVLFREGHDLAVNLLVHALRSASKARDRIAVHGEVRGEYGKLDVLVKRLSGGLLLVSSGTNEVIVEIKTNVGFSLKQVLRYLLERPSATAVIWRVRKRQVLFIDGKKHRWLIALFAFAAIQQGLTVLNGEFEECGHSPPKNSPYELLDPQVTLDDFLTCLVEGLPKVVDLVLGILKGQGPANNSS